MSKNLHPNNPHNAPYEFKKLIGTHADLQQYVFTNQFGVESINFANPAAVKSINIALLKFFYKIKHYQLPSQNLCPPIPGRADYIHYVADLIEFDKKGKKINVLDIGTGANCIYPILGHQIYGWNFVGSDIEKKSIRIANENLTNNNLNKNIQIRLQNNPNHIFKGIIKKGEFYDCTLCNPPFHTSAAEATKGSLRKVKNLGLQKNNEKPTLNFGGNPNELWCKGGELTFISNMIKESVLYQNQCNWFTTLVSKKENLKPLQKQLERLKIRDIKIIPMIQGNKTTRILAWRFKS